MAASGFDYKAVSYDSYPPKSASNRLNEKVALTFGYHDPAPPLDPNAQSVNNSPAWSAAFGQPGEKTGCGTISYSYAKGGPYASKLEADDLFNLIVSQADVFWKTPEYASLVSEWSKCMAAAGYSYATPDDASTRYNSRPNISSEELRTRAADLQCDKRVKLTETSSAQSLAICRGVMEKYASQIAERTILARNTYNELLERQQRLQSVGVSALSAVATDASPTSG